MAWTEADEAQLQQLQVRKQNEALSLRREVERIVDTFYFREMWPFDLVEELMKHATVIRKALKPFDKEDG